MFYLTSRTDDDFFDRCRVIFRSFPRAMMRYCLKMFSNIPMRSFRQLLSTVSSKLRAQRACILVFH